MLTREQLLRVLALPSDASERAIRTASQHLAGILEARRAALGDEATLRDEAAGDAEALTRELDDLRQCTLWWTSERSEAPAADASIASAGSARRSEAPGRAGPDWERLAPALGVVGVLAAIALLALWTAGFRIERLDPGPEPALYAAKAVFFIEGDLGDATLRVFDADRSELLAERPAERARVELEPGRYALEVRRADCPEPWTRSVFLEPDSSHHFAPEICVGEGELVVRSDDAQDRLRIDDYDVGHTGDRAHRLAVGEHTVRVDKAGHRPFEARVRILPGAVVELRADLTPVGGDGAPVGRPLPVARPAPSRPPMAAAEAFSQAELRGGLGAPAIEPPKIEPADLGLPRRGSFLAREGLPAMPDGGSTAWHDRVAGELRARFDRDGSGEIDTLAESEAIPCPVWLEIERDFDRGGLGLSLAHYFGFDGSEWHPGALAVARAHRSAVYAKMQECGLDP
ncbi:MAG: PEGA domain-containing protein [Myxococcota bacterium]